jgi:hypothetical protein
LNVGEIQQSTLVQFGIKMLLNPQMKKQIISLKLSNKNIPDNIKTLFSFISLNEFSNLRALILSDLDIRTAVQISSMLPILTNLRYCCLQNSSLVDAELLASLAKSTIQTLSISTLPRYLAFTHPFPALIDVTISSCFVETLCYLLEYSPGLQYLNVKNIRQSYGRTVDQSQSLGNHVVHLKRLVIQNFADKFDGLERLLKRTPSLKVLIIASNYNLDIADACGWRKLIRMSLPLLDIFKFKFHGTVRNDNNEIVNKFKQFHTDFWHQQHRWYVEYVISKRIALIYTVPYISNEYEIMPNAKRYYHESANNMKTFANVTDLKVCLQNIRDNAEYYFSNVKSLRLEVIEHDENQDHSFLKMKHIECFKMMINVCSLAHLEIPSQCRWKSASVMLQLLKEALHLSSLKSDINTLMAMFNNCELCRYLRKVIKKLDVTGRYCITPLSSDEIVNVCQIFSNLEAFQCYVGSPANLEMILAQLSKLPHMKVFSYKTYNWNSGHCWTGVRKAELDLYSFTIKCEYRDRDFDDMSYLGYDYSGDDLDWQ